MKLYELASLAVIFILQTAAWCPVSAAEAATAEPVFALATLVEGQELLGTSDEFSAALSRFDRAARMKTDRPVSEEQFLAFVRTNVQPWSAAESNRLGQALTIVKEKTTAWKVPLPERVLLIKTSGKEEGGASYTRQNAVVLPVSELKRANGLEDTILHELFHVASRHSPPWRKDLYGLIGFHQINAVPYPPELRERKITNPDGVQDGWRIEVTNGNQRVSTIPVLYASIPEYDPTRGGEFFDFLRFKLLVVEKVGERWQPRLTEARPELLEPRAVHGFFEQIGRNTDYIIHPDEILAVNFVHLVNGDTGLASPGVIAQLRGVLARDKAE